MPAAPRVCKNPRPRDPDPHLLVLPAPLSFDELFLHLSPWQSATFFWVGPVINIVHNKSLRYSPSHLCFVLLRHRLGRRLLDAFGHLDLTNGS